MPPIQPRRGLVLSIVALFAFLSFTVVYRFRARPDGVEPPDLGFGHANVPGETLNGHVIAPKLGNETEKAELGRAAWKLFHTTMARFPDRPTADESAALRSYVLLFARLYPCGECAGHFQQILTKFPPQVSSRTTAAAWACHVHNEVNRSLAKEIFDCSKIGDFYHCGCAEDDVDGPSGSGHRTNTQAKEGSESGAASGGRHRSDWDPGKDPPPIRLEREGLTKGG